MNTPVALIIFNRPSKTKMVFHQIAKVKPPKLFIIADGPRPDHPEDFEKCAATRAIVDHVDWNCEVFKNYSETNLNCGVRPASGISWVFEHVEEAIILEDDCLPHPTFFDFCEELLARYKNDERVMMIGGSNIYFEKVSSDYSYLFCKIPACWGWATWRRAWKHYDMDLSLWPSLRDTNWLSDFLVDPVPVSFWWKTFNEAYIERGNVDYWDFQWAFACWLQHGFTILPSVNLVSNIGCSEDATHTTDPKAIYANMPALEMRFPLDHPPHILWNRKHDQISSGQSSHEKEIKRSQNFRIIIAFKNLLPIWLISILRELKSKFLHRLMKP